MAKKITDFYNRPDPDTEYIEIEPPYKPDNERVCCVCNSGNTLCSGEQGFTHFATSVFAQTLAYVIT